MSSGDLTEEVRANKLAQEISGGLLTRASDVFLNVHGRPEVGRGWEGGRLPVHYCCIACGHRSVIALPRISSEEIQKRHSQ
jgi:hypothetical protein